MNTKQLDNLCRGLNISADKIIREEAEMIFLNQLAGHNLGAKVVFYGGTALRLAYNSPRFSEDIDLMRIKPIAFKEFALFIEQVIKKNPAWKLKDIKNKRNTIFALILIKDDKLKHAFSVKIEIYKPRERTGIKTELLLIKSPVSIFSPLLLAPTLLEMKNLKIKALAGRKKARDVFDLWFIAQALREQFRVPEQAPRFKRQEFKNELQVFLPKKYYPIVDQLYDKINTKNK